MTAAGTADSTDKSLGIAMLFGALAVAASLFTFAAPTQYLSALGFGAAVTTAVLAVAAFHLYD